MSLLSGNLIVADRKWGLVSRGLSDAGHQEIVGAGSLVLSTQKLHWAERPSGAQQAGARLHG